MFLEENELFALTGRKYAAKQMQWLSKNGIKYLVAADGTPRVLKTHIEEIMGNVKRINQRRQEPDFSNINKRIGFA